MSITQGIVDAVVRKVPDARVRSVRVEIGRLSGVVPDSVRFCFDLVAAGTTLAGATLQIDEPAGRGRCRTCGAECTLDDPIVLCDCGSANVEILTGRELRIRSVEVV